MASPNELIKLVSDLINTIISYVKGQTLVPLKRLGRYLGLGIAGSFFIANGMIFISLGILRYLQSLETFKTNLTFLPYIILCVFDIALVGILFFLASRPSLIKEKQ